MRRSSASCCIALKRGGTGTSSADASRSPGRRAHAPSQRPSGDVDRQGRRVEITARAAARRARGGTPATPSGHVRRRDPPFGDQPIGRRAAMQRARHARRRRRRRYVAGRRAEHGKFRCAFGACSGSNVHSIERRRPAPAPRSRCATSAARPRPCGRERPAATPSMCDHCVGRPSRQPGIDQTKPTIASLADAPSRMPPRLAETISTEAGTISLSCPRPPTTRRSPARRERRCRESCDAAHSLERSRYEARSRSGRAALSSAAHECRLSTERPAARPATESPAHPSIGRRDVRRARAGCRACRRGGRRRRRGPGCRRPSPPRPARHLHQLERRAEDARMRLHEAVLGRRHGDGDQAVELEVRLERREAAVRIRDQTRAARPALQRRSVSARRRRARSGGARPSRRRSRARPPRAPGRCRPSAR